MPIYEYKCKQCGAVYEKRQNVSDPPLTTCEKCHGELEKQWSLSGFQFKGGGWYVTDYASGSKSSGKTGSSESTSSGDAASNSTSDTTSSPAKEKPPAKS
ncbi:MAG: putative regulatory protein, FmdB family [Acidobacteria bacterium OLB17]|nr:MAG: putative regulatory protein, FmdB family [Acidobacteria bacterium OLB17]MCZ2390711.1 zinc ribbon domain-containing protein [Acidobacteriota bacterium]